MQLQSIICHIVTMALFIAPLQPSACTASCPGTYNAIKLANGREKSKGGAVNIILLHHSTGERIWSAGVAEWFEAYNQRHGTKYDIVERIFPKQFPYGWNNYPYDYWNIWVNHASQSPYQEEPTLEMLTGTHDVIIFKHCFPVCEILEDTGSPDIASPEKRIENYRLQYEALKAKMHEFPTTTFIVWTGAAEVDYTNTLHKIAAFVKGREGIKQRAKRIRTFFEWLKTEWDEPGDNIYVWDFFELETEGGLFLKKEYAQGQSNSHPNESFSRTVAPYLCQRVVDIIEGRGDRSSITGKEPAPLSAPRH